MRANYLSSEATEDYRSMALAASQADMAASQANMAASQANMAASQADMAAACMVWQAVVAGQHARHCQKATVWFLAVSGDLLYITTCK